MSSNNGKSLFLYPNFLNLSIYVNFSLATSRLKVRVGRRSGQDAALSLLLGHTSLKEDVAIHAPAGSPRVLHLVVVHAVEGAVSDSKHAVVQVGAARGGEHTRLVELEGGLVGLDGDRHGLLRDGGHQCSVRVRLHVSIRRRCDFRIDGVLRLSAGASSLCGTRHVHVVGLVGKTPVLLDPAECIVHEASIADMEKSLNNLFAKNIEKYFSPAGISATVLEVVTVNQVLLGEDLQGAVLWL